MNYSTGRKYARVKLGKDMLEVACLRDGTLDVCLKTGKVYSVWSGVRTERVLHVDEDGYLGFWLSRERKDGRGKPDRYGRRRIRRYVFVHRLVKIKAIAYAKGGVNWQSFLCNLPHKVDVNHINTIRTDNTADNLELMTEQANRLRRPATDDEYAELKAAGW